MGLMLVALVGFAIALAVMAALFSFGRLSLTGQLVGELRSRLGSGHARRS